MKNCLLTLALLPLLLIAGPASAELPTQGQTLPAVAIAKPGALVKTDDGFDLRPFSTEELNGQVVSIHAVAGRLGIDKKNAPYVEALKAAGLPADRFATVSIIDQSQAVIGTKGLVLGKAEDKQREFPTTQFVVDGDGAASKAWGLKKKGYAVIVIDDQGHVLRAHDGALSDEQIADFITAIRTATQD